MAYLFTFLSKNVLISSGFAVWGVHLPSLQHRIFLCISIVFVCFLENVMHPPLISFDVLMKRKIIEFCILFIGLPFFYGSGFFFSVYFWFFTPDIFRQCGQIIGPNLLSFFIPFHKHVSVRITQLADYRSSPSTVLFIQLNCSNSVLI